MRPSRHILFLFALLCIMAGFYLLNHYTHLYSDDYSIAYERGYGRIDNMEKVVGATRDYYLTWSGAIMPTVIGHIMAGCLQGGPVFHIINTLMAACLLLLMYLLCRQKEAKDRHTPIILLLWLVILLWWCTPMPCETLLWMAGSINYLWNGVWIMLFIWLYDQCNCEKKSLLQLLLLFFISFTAGSTHILAVTAIGMALTVYNILYRKHITRTHIVMCVGFLLGAAVLLLAPGNRVRYMEVMAGYTGAAAHIRHIVYSCLLTWAHYKVVYAVAIVLIVWSIRNLSGCRDFCRNHIWLLLVTAAMVISYSFIFRPEPRNAFYAELMAMVVLVKMLTTYVPHKKNIIFIVILSIFTMADYVYAVSCARRQYAKNEALLAELQSHGGEACFETVLAPHRMVNPIRIDSWARYGIMQHYGLDTLVLHPKVYALRQHFPQLCHAAAMLPQVHAYAYDIQGACVLQVPCSESGSACLHVEVEYSVPRLWHRVVRQAMGLYKLEQQCLYCLPADYEYGGYKYYIIPSLYSPQDATIRKLTMYN